MNHQTTHGFPKRKKTEKQSAKQKKTFVFRTAHSHDDTKCWACVLVRELYKYRYRYKWGQLQVQVHCITPHYTTQHHITLHYLYITLRLERGRVAIPCTAGNLDVSSLLVQSIISCSFGLYSIPILCNAVLLHHATPIH